MIRHLITNAIVVAVIAGALATSAVAAPTSRQATRAQGQPPAPAPLVNLNTATKADLEKLPGVGPAVAQRILDYRQKNGAFKKVEELMNVQGIGEKSFLKLRTLVTVAPPKTSER